MTDKKRKRAVYMISVAAELAGVHPQTLRIYERKGLIDPYRTAGGTRRYSQEDIERLARIQQLTDEGLNLEGVRRVMELTDQIERLERRIGELERELEVTRRQSDQRVADAHRSHRFELVLRSSMLPQRRR